MTSLENRAYFRAVLIQWIVLFASAACLTLLLGAIFYEMEITTERYLVKEEESELVDVARWALEGDMDLVVTDLRVLASLPPVRAFLEAPSDEGRDLAVATLCAFVDAKQMYDRIGLYNATGDAILNVAFVDGRATATPIGSDDAAADEANFDAAFNLAWNQIYISPMEIEHVSSDGQTPPHALFWLGAPLADDQHRKRGAILVKYRASGLLDHIDRIGQGVNSDIILLDRKGAWLHHPAPGSRWATTYLQDSDHSFSTLFPEVWKRMNETPVGQMENAEGMFSFVPARAASNEIYELMHVADSVASQPLWHLISHVTNENWNTRTMRLRRAVIAAMFLLLLIEGGAAAWIARGRARNRQMAAALAESERLYRTLAENFPNGAVMLFDQDMNCLLAEGSGLHMLGVPAGKAPGASLRDFFDPELVTHVQSYLHEDLDQQHQQFEYETGGRVFHTFLVPVRGEDGRVLNEMVMIQDVSEQKSLESRLRFAATRDELTGLYNRRHFLERLRECIEIARRYKSPLSLCICDVDKFKSVNDTCGHLMGDQILSTFGRIIESELRATDVPARYGGDEFCLIFPENESAQAVVVLERIRVLFAGTTFTGDDGQTFSVSGSFGVVDYPQPDGSVESFIKAADDCLYRAKSGGRNQIASGQPEPPPAT